MGIVFVFFLHLIGIGILSGVIVVIASIIAFFLSKKENRKRNLLITIISPPVALYTLYMCAIIGSGFVSTTKNIDMGIGDTWNVPLTDSCQLVFIDLPENGYLENNGQTIISGVSQLQEIDNKILGKTNDSTYFYYNTSTNELKKYTSENEFILQNANSKPNLINANKFYSDKRKEIAGTALNLVGIISILLSVTATYITIKIILRLAKK